MGNDPSRNLLIADISREAIAQMTGLTIHEVRLKWPCARAWLQVAINQG